MQLPDDAEGRREFVSWHRLEGDDGKKRGLTPRQKDELLSRVADCLESGQLPEFSDCLQLEEGVLSYLDLDNETSKGASSDYGFRNKVSGNQKPVPTFDGTSPGDLRGRWLEVMELLRQGKLPHDAVRNDLAARLKAYVSREINAAKLLGEKARKPRAKSIWQVRDTICACADYLHNRVRKADGSRLSGNSHELSYDDGNLYTLLHRLVSSARQLTMSGDPADDAFGGEIERIIGIHGLSQESETKAALREVLYELFACTQLEPGIGHLTARGLMDIHRKI